MKVNSHITAMKRIEQYCNMTQWGSEVEMGVKHDVERGNVPESWYPIMKGLDFNPQAFKAQYLKEMNDGTTNENVQGSSGDEEDTRSDMPDTERGR